MSKYSKQKFFCNVCGKEMFVSISDPYTFRFCGAKCNEEFNWRKTLSILGEDYRSPQAK